MATITSDTYLDGGTARTAGEAWAIYAGARFTVRTDTRWHANSPASMTGSFGSLTITQGEIYIDATAVRWLAITGGSGTPTIGDTVSQGGVSGYFLGFWSSLTAAPSATVGATGFLKLREVTGGAFSAGALTFSGAGAATAAGADTAGWLEVVCDYAANITVPRLGKFTTRGNWFYLDNTTGSVGQVLQVPTNGGGADTHCWGVWIERTTPNSATYTWAADVVTVTLTSHGYVVGQNVDLDFTSGGATADGEFIIVSVPTANTFTATLSGSGTAGNCTVTSFDFWPGLYGATNGWARQHLGGPYGATDVRQNFVKSIGSGQMQIGEASDLSATYASVAGQSSTDYDSLTQASTYTWTGDIVTVTYATGHLLTTGQQTYLDFSSGGATSYDGTYTVTVLDAYTYTVPLSGSGASGNVTAKPGYRIAFTAHGLGMGDEIYCNFTSGSGADGLYTVWAVSSADLFYISAPHSVTDTTKLVTFYAKYRITSVAHGLALGNRVYLDFSTGSGVDGIYTIVAVAADTFDIIANNGVAGDSGNVTVKQTIGNIPTSGLRTRISNIFLRACATASRATNAIPNATVATNPEFATTAAGYIDMEYVYSQWYHNFAQSYLAKHHHFALVDQLIISECASAIDLHDGGLGMYSNRDSVTLALTSDFASGTVKNCKFTRGNTPGTNDHCVSLSYCIGQTFRNVVAGIIQFARSSGYPYQNAYCSSISYHDCISVNSGLTITSSFDCSVYNLDHVDRFIGYTNATTGHYPVLVTTKCDNIMVDGISWGRRWGLATSNVHSYSGIANCTSSDNVTIRNAGSFSAPLSGGNWRINAYGVVYAYVSGGNNTYIKLQRLYLDNTITGLISTINSDKGITYESVYGGSYVLSAIAIYALIDAGLNSISKGCKAGQNTVAGQTSVYGTHFRDMFLGDTTGRFILACNEPTTETSSYFTMVAGTASFNSAGSIFLKVAADQAIWEDSCYRLGHTGFVISAPTITSTTNLIITATSRAGGNVTFTTLAHDLNIGDTVIVTGVTPAGYNGVHVVTAVPSTTTFTVVLADPGAWSSGGTILQLDNADLYYALNQGTVYGSFYNLKYTRTGGATTSGNATITMTSTTGVAVDDYVTSRVAGVGVNAKVLSVDTATQITVDVNSSATTAANVLYFNHLPNETISDPAIGFKMKIKAIATANCNTNAITYVRIDTTTTSSAQSSNLYTLDVATVTIDNPVLGSSYEVYNIDTSAPLASGVVSADPQTVSVLASAGQTLRIRLRRSKGVLLYESQTIDFTVGAILMGLTSGARATIGEDNDSGTTGSLTLENLTGVFIDGEIIIDNEGGSATANGVVSGKYFPFETNAVVSSTLTANVYASQTIDTIAV